MNAGDVITAKELKEISERFGVIAGGVLVDEIKETETFTVNMPFGAPVEFVNDQGVVTVGWIAKF